MLNALQLYQGYVGTDQDRELKRRAFEEQSQQRGLQNQLLEFNMMKERAALERENQMRNRLAQMGGRPDVNTLMAVDPKLAFKAMELQRQDKAQNALEDYRRNQLNLRRMEVDPNYWQQQGQPAQGQPMFGGQPSNMPPMSPRDKAMLYRQNVESGQRQLEKESEAMSNLSPIEERLNRWKELNADVVTGPVTGYRPSIFAPKFQELKQLENWFSANNFKPGQGQISNYERAMIKQSGPNTLYDRATNDRIITLQQGAVKNMKDRNQFKQAYLEQKGTLLGSDAAWQKYLDANPRYVNAPDGSIKENPKWQSWTEWKGQDNKPAATQNQASPEIDELVKKYAK